MKFTSIDVSVTIPDAVARLHHYGLDWLLRGIREVDLSIADPPGELIVQPQTEAPYQGASLDVNLRDVPGGAAQLPDLRGEWPERAYRVHPHEQTVEVRRAPNEPWRPLVALARVHYPKP